MTGLLASELLASIPSPSKATIGPLHAYGLMIALGVLAAAWLMGRRMEHDRIGVRDDAYGIAMWAVPFGVIGARLYHVVTKWEDFRHDLPRIVKVWQGGLGIWGGIALGVVAGVVVMKRRRLAASRTLACAVPALPLAQAIGRWGNWWNQELFGRPTTLPWGLKIDEAHRPDQYLTSTTFHPTFLYESLWNLALCGFLLWYDRKHQHRVRGGRLLAMYAVGYTLARFFIEGLRVDEAHHIGGLRVNEWVSIAVGGIALIYLVASSRNPYVPVGLTPDVVADALHLPAVGVEHAVGGEELVDDLDDLGDPLVEAADDVDEAPADDLDLET